RSQAQAQVAQVLPLLACGEFEVRLGPRPRPAVLVAVESRRGGPVDRGQFEGVADAEAALVGGVDEGEPAERPERLPAEVGAVLLVDHEDAPAGAGQFMRGDETDASGADAGRVGAAAGPARGSRGA